jgi:nucleoside-diphosphate-sugar epimerase
MEPISSIRRVVYTSSFASILDANAVHSPGKVYTASDWNPSTYEDGVNARTVADAYRASKVAAERIAWDFMRTHGPPFDLVSLCPAMTFGTFLPHCVPKSISELNTSNALVWRAIKGGENGTVPPTKGPVWVDVRDIALAHIKSLLVPAAGGRRFLVGASMYSNQQLVDLSRERLPQMQDRMAVGQPGTRDPGVQYNIDSKETEQVLDLKWRDLGDCLADVVPQLFDIEAGGKWT